MAGDRKSTLAAESAVYDRLVDCGAAEAVLFADKIAIVWEAQRLGAELHTEDFVVCEVALNLTVSEAAAAVLLKQAEGCRRHPEVYRLLAAGELGVPHTAALLDELGKLDPAFALDVEQAVLDKLSDLTPGEIRTLVRKQVIALDPAAAAERRRKVARDRHVSLFPEADGMAGLWALMGAVDAKRVDARLSALAAEHRRRHPDDPRTIAQLRPDLLAAAVTGELDPDVATNAAGVQVHVQVPVAVALGLADVPGDLAGYGPIDPDLVRTLIPDAELRRVCVDRFTGRPLTSDDGTLTMSDDVAGEVRALVQAALAAWAATPVVDVDLPEAGYRPSAKLAARVRRRDATCEFGRCTVSSERCDLDHRDAWPQGPTSGRNLGAKSRRHHRAKQAGWQLQHLPDGSIITISPSGRRYLRPARSDPPPALTRTPAQPTGPPAQRFDLTLRDAPQPTAFEVVFQGVVDDALAPDACTTHVDYGWSRRPVEWSRLILPDDPPF